MVSSVIKTVLTDTSKNKKKKKSKNTQINDVSLENQSLQDLMQLIEKHQNYLKLSKDNDRLSEERKRAIVEEIDVVFFNNELKI